MAKQPSEQIHDLSNLEYHLTRYIASGKSHVCLFLSGKTGVGKSHLTNALIGEEVAKEGDLLDPMTMDPVPYKTKMNGVLITAWDTPGMADGSHRDQAYLKNMVKEIKDVDLFLYCAEMNTQRVRNDDIKCIQDLTKAFGYQLWNNALIVLTFANEVHPAKGNDVSGKEYFLDRLRKFKKKYYSVLEQTGIPELMVRRVPVVPVGELSEPKLPDRGNWIMALWIQAFKRMTEKAQPAMLLANYHRIAADCESVEGETPLDGNIIWDEFFSESAGVGPLQNSWGAQVKLSREGRLDWQSQHGSLTPDKRSPKVVGRKIWPYACNREHGSALYTSGRLAEREVPATNEADASQPSAGRNESGRSAGSLVESDKHKKTGSDEDTEIQQNTERIVTLRMSQDFMLEVYGEVSKDMMGRDGEEYGDVGQVIGSWFSSTWGEHVGRFGGYALGAFITLVRKVCKKVIEERLKQCPN